MSEENTKIEPEEAGELAAPTAITSEEGGELAAPVALASLAPQGLRPLQDSLDNGDPEE